MAETRAVVTITCGEFYEKMSRVTHPFIKRYAEKIGADFIVLNEAWKHTIPHYLKLELADLLKKYDRILYIDTDILVRDDAPDIFGVVPKEKLGIFEEGQFAERAVGMYQFMNEEGVNGRLWNRKYYNTGVMVLSRQHAPLFIKPPVEKDHFKEQTYLNLIICIFGPQIHTLHYKWNRMSIMDQITGEDRFDSYFLHYAGMTEALPKDRCLEIIRNDIEIWKRGFPDYKYKKNIAVMVEGGLGDQICAEPSIRTMRDKVFKGDNIIIITDYPDAFRHMGLPVFKKEQQLPDAGKYHVIHTLRTPEHISWEYMSHPLCHGVDFCSLQSLRLTLPVPAKTVQLSYFASEFDSVRKKMPFKLNECVLLHPGRGWDSKTFPADVWQSYLNILLENDYKVAIIGKRISAEQGVVEFDWNKPNCVNLIDNLSYGELTALISQAPVLISNDSAPIHIAGSFDNWIGLIATCKHPDHVLPYRNNGDVYYKAKALEVGKLYEVYDSSPTQVYGATIDKCTEEQMRGCLPSSENILKFVQECFEETGGAKRS